MRKSSKKSAASCAALFFHFAFVEVFLSSHGVSGTETVLPRGAGAGFAAGFFAATAGFAVGDAVVAAGAFFTALASFLATGAGAATLAATDGVVGSGFAAATTALGASFALVAMAGLDATGFASTGFTSTGLVATGLVATTSFGFAAGCEAFFATLVFGFVAAGFFLATGCFAFVSDAKYGVITARCRLTD